MQNLFLPLFMFGLGSMEVLALLFLIVIILIVFFVMKSRKKR
jgi:hypothetical protein